MALTAIDARKITSLADGTTVTAANSASPDQITPNISAPGTVKWRADQAIAGAPAHFEFDGSGIARGDITVNSATVAMNVLGWMTNITTSDNLIVRAFSASTSVSLTFRGASRTLDVTANGGAILDTSPTIPNGSLYRIHLGVLKGTTTSNGAIRAELFIGANVDGDVPDWTFTSTAANTGTVNFTALRIGKQTSGPVHTYRMIAARFSDSQADFSGGLGAPFTPPAVRSAISIQNDGQSSQVLNKPANVITGDLLLAFHEGDDATPTTVSSTWTQIESGDSPGAVGAKVQTKTWQRWAAGGEPSSYTFGWSTGNDVSAGILAIEGADPTNPLLDPPTVGTGTGTSMVAPSVTGIEGGLLVCVWYIRSDATARSATPPVNMNEQIDTLGTWASICVATEKLTADGATGTRTATFPISAAYRALSFVVQPEVAFQSLTADLAMDAVAGLAIAGSLSRSVILAMDAQDGMVVGAVRSQPSVLAAAASSTLAIAGVKSRLSVLALAAAGSSLTISGATGAVSTLSVTASGLLVVAGSESRTAVVVATATGILVLSPLRTQPAVLTVAGLSGLAVSGLRTQSAVLTLAGVSSFVPNTGAAGVVAVRGTPILTIASRQSFLRVLAVRGIPTLTIGAVLLLDYHPGGRVRAIVLDSGRRVAVVLEGGVDAEVLSGGFLAAILRGV